MSYFDDQQILNLILSGHNKNEGFRHLVGKYKEKLYWHIRRIVQDHDDTDDILQNTFIKVARNIGKFQQQSSLYTWLYRIATNESINFINTRKKKQFERIEDTIMLTHKSNESLDDVMVLDRLAKAIDTLPEKQKLVFNLRYYDEMSYQDMAEITETSVGALKASYHHAVKKIEEHLKSEI